MRSMERFLGIALLAAGLSGTLTGFCATPSDPADPKLAAAYRQLHFFQMYPPSAVSYIGDRLQNEKQPIGPLTEFAKDQKPEVRVLAATLLGELGDSEGTRPLWEMTRDDSELVRTTAAGALVRLAELTPVTISVEGLKDKRPAVRRLTAATLRNLHDRAAELDLIDTLHDEDEMVRMEAANALGECGTPQCIPSLIETLQDRSVLVRTAAATSLGRFNESASVSALIDAMKDADWHVRAASLLSLARVTSQHDQQAAGVSEPIIGKLKSDDYALVRDRAADALWLPNNEKAVTALVQALVSEDRAARFHAAQAIIACKAVSALPQLMQYRHHPDPEVREKIMDIFGSIGNNDQLAAVIDGTNDTDPTVQLAALTALRKMRERGGSDTLIGKLSDPNPHVRAAAVRALGDMGDRSVTPKLVPLLRDESGYVRSAAAEALGKLGDRTAIVPLIDLLAGQKLSDQAPGAGGLVVGTGASFLSELSQLTEVQQKARAVEALGVLRAPEAVEPIIKYGLKAQDPTLRAVSAYSLGEIRDPRAVEPLQDVVRPYYHTAPADLENVIDVGTGTVPDTLRVQREREARVRASVAWALGQLGDSAASATLKQALNDQNSLVRDAAAEALAKISERAEKIEDTRRAGQQAR
jgi:HEAT repeat protein